MKRRLFVVKEEAPDDEGQGYIQTLTIRIKKEKKVNKEKISGNSKVATIKSGIFYIINN